MNVLPNDQRTSQVERRKNPRPEATMRYKRLRQEIQPPQAIAAATESLFSWIGQVSRRVTASVTYLRKLIEDRIRYRRMTKRSL